jgi:hypothetical protein
MGVDPFDRAFEQAREAATQDREDRLAKEGVDRRALADAQRDHQRDEIDRSNSWANLAAVAPRLVAEFSKAGVRAVPLSRRSLNRPRIVKGWPLGIRAVRTYTASGGPWDSSDQYTSGLLVVTATGELCALDMYGIPESPLLTSVPRQVVEKPSFTPWRASELWTKAAPTQDGLLRMAAKIIWNS